MSTTTATCALCPYAAPFLAYMGTMCGWFGVSVPASGVKISQGAPTDERLEPAELRGLSHELMTVGGRSVALRERIAWKKDERSEIVETMPPPLMDAKISYLIQG